MALWIKTRPDNAADPTELAVARRLADLDDGWLVIWGWYYAGDRGGPLDREGDFLVQSPSGDVMVIEVKGGTFRRFVATGEWELEGRKDPRQQLNEQCQAVRESLRRHAVAGKIPGIAKALALPSVGALDYETPGSGWEETVVLDRDTLDNFGHQWADTFGPRAENTVNAPMRELFLKAFADDARPEALRTFARMTDLLFVRQTREEYRLLDQLWENPRFLVRGGPGTGKSFLAIECARRFAEEHDGRDVLLPVFNLPLCEHLRRLFRAYPPRRGAITVVSQDDLADMLHADADVPAPRPDDAADAEARSRFYRETLPNALGKLLAEGRVTPKFDALVVDEAQDHDTRQVGLPDGPWSLYRALLRAPETARVALFLDENQRPLFNGPDGFEREKLAALFPGAVRIRLDRTLRYTDPIDTYLRSLADEPGETGRHAHAAAPTGAPVITGTLTADALPEAIATTLRTWRELGVIDDPRDVMLLSPRRHLANTSLGRLTEIEGVALIDHDERDDAMPPAYRHLNIHRAKGLDERAVIVFDLKPARSEEQLAMRRQQHLLGASRARQALAVFHLRE